MMAAAAAAPMEAQTAQPPSDASSAAYPRWVMLQKDLRIEVEGSSCSTSGDSKTLAAARDQQRPPDPSLPPLFAEPPGVSCVCLHIPDGLDEKYSSVVAAHGDSVLIEVSLEEKYLHRLTADLFVYNAGAAAGDCPRPPTMSLPFCVRRPTGLVRRGDDLVVVAQFTSVPAGPDTPELVREADLTVFRSGEWSIKRVQIEFCDASVVPEPEQLPSLCNDVVPIGDGLLCWVDLYRSSFLLWDVFDETHRLQYLRLPWKNMWGLGLNQNVIATAGGDVLKFVNILPRCCCGGHGESSCERSCHAYTIETWTMRIGDAAMEWVMDGVVDSTELWALDSYKGLRCFPLNHPVVSLDDPEVVCFWLHEPPVDGHWTYDDKTVDVLMINTRSKTIHSVSRYEDGLQLMRNGLIPSNVSYFFNSYLGSGRDATFPEQRQGGIERLPPVAVDEQLIRENDNGSNPITLALFTEPPVQASEIFEAFQEIPTYGLDHDELKAYRILSRDNCRRFKSFSRLPKNLRKDWLLMEIDASED